MGVGVQIQDLTAKPCMDLVSLATTYIASIARGKVSRIKKDC